MKKNRRPDIQGLRAIAVLMVVAFHANLPTPGGFAGVDVFFVISGFVIAGMLHREWHSNGRIDFGRFYLRRFKRLTPALALLVAATILLSVAILSPLGIQQNAAYTGVGAMFLVANIVIARTTKGYFSADAHTNPLLHTWSLSVEEQFYLLFPALIAIGWTLARRNKNMRSAPQLIVLATAAVSLGLALFSVPITIALQTRALAMIGPRVGLIDKALGYYSLFTRAWEFAAGVLLALATPKLLKLSSKFALAVGLTGATMLAVALFLNVDEATYPNGWTLIPVVGTLFVLAAGTVGANGVSQVLSTRPMVRIGDWSYSIYLWHWPFVVFATALWPAVPHAPLAAAVLSFAPAIASYRWVEEPMREMTDFSGWKAARVIAFTVGVPVLICGSLLVAVQHGFWSSKVQMMQAAALGNHATTGCNVARSAAGPTRPCEFNAQAAGAPIYLVGDSTAWHFTEAAIGAGETLKRPVEVLPINGCPFRDVYMTSKNQIQDNQCRQQYESAIDWLSNQPSGTVVISGLNREHHDGSKLFSLEPGEPERESHEQAARVLDEGLIRTISKLKSTGHSVVLVQTAPIFESFRPDRCSIQQLTSGRCSLQTTRAEMDEYQRIERSAIQQIAGETGSGIWDPRAFFCNDETCSTEKDGVPIYRDSSHITSHASGLLGASLATAIEAVPSAKPGN